MTLVGALRRSARLAIALRQQGWQAYALPAFIGGSHEQHSQQTCSEDHRVSKGSVHYGWAAMCAWKAVRKPAESAAALSGFPVNMQGSLRTTLAGTAPNMTVPKPLYNPLMPSWPRMLRAVSLTPCTHQRLLLRRAQVEILT